MKNCYLRISANLYPSLKLINAHPQDDSCRNLQIWSNTEFGREIIVLGVTVEIRNVVSEGIDYFIYFTVNCRVLIVHLCNVEDE
jgi:hypothetical protein